MIISALNWKLKYVNQFVNKEKKILNTKLIYHILENFLSFEKIIKISILSYSQIHHFTWYISHIHHFSLCIDRYTTARDVSVDYVIVRDVSRCYTSVYLMCINQIHHYVMHPSFITIRDLLGLWVMYLKKRRNVSRRWEMYSKLERDVSGQFEMCADLTKYIRDFFNLEKSKN